MFFRLKALSTGTTGSSVGQEDDSHCRGSGELMHLKKGGGVALEDSDPYPS